ncbi:MAG: hypothetical protein CMH83_16435 [Nocardioides sp.]|nr:hypothetical protein [Nocardioides sp.]
MTTQATDAPGTVPRPVPTRHREAEARGRRLGRALRAIARVEEVDEDLMDRLGRGFTERDELGARLADAMRMRAGAPGRVTHPALAAALAAPQYVPVDAPEALREYVGALTQVPDWVNWDLVEAGGDVLRRLGQNAADVLLQLSLVGGYRFGGPTDLLVATGGLTGDMTVRRLAETQAWATAIAEPGALRPGGEGWRLTLHVRAMHALVNAGFEPRWDAARWGLPINQTDQAATLGLFDGVPLLGCRALGVPITRAESRAWIHLFRYTGWLMGVHEDFLVATERERHRLNYHVLLAQADLSPAGPALAQAVVEAQSARRYPRFQRVRSVWERERLLSMLTVFLGRASMRELGLPARPPWAHAYVVPLNLVRYHLLGRLPGGRARLERWGSRVSAGILDSYYGSLPHAEGALPTDSGTRPNAA